MDGASDQRSDSAPEDQEGQPPKPGDGAPASLNAEAVISPEQDDAGPAVSGASIEKHLIIRGGLIKRVPWRLKVETTSDGVDLGVLDTLDTGFCRFVLGTYQKHPLCRFKFFTELKALRNCACKPHQLGGSNIMQKTKSDWAMRRDKQRAAMAVQDESELVQLVLPDIEAAGEVVAEGITITVKRPSHPAEKLRIGISEGVLNYIRIAIISRGFRAEARTQPTKTPGSSRKLRWRAPSTKKGKLVPGYWHAFREPKGGDLKRQGKIFRAADSSEAARDRAFELASSWVEGSDDEDPSDDLTTNEDGHTATETTTDDGEAESPDEKRQRHAADSLSASSPSTHTAASSSSQPSPQSHTGLSPGWADIFRKKDQSVQKKP